MPLDHSSDPESKSHSHNRRESFGNCCNCECNAPEKHLKRIKALKDSEHCYKSNNNKSCGSKPAPELVELFLQRGSFPFDFSQETGKFSKSSTHACCRNYCFPPAIGNRSSGISHIFPVRLRSFGKKNFDAFFYRNRFSCERRFVDFKRLSLKQSGICRYSVPCLQNKDISRDK
ncbi:hypothetical protein DSECCO2_478200 [anaerobic digester metagenome]